jgi:hypothetical protein
MGEVITDAQAQTSCDPVVTNYQMGVSKAYDNITTLDPNATAYPCGLIARSVFTDNYTISDS